MLVVLASAHDLGARALVARLRARGATAELLLCSDLGRPGWRLRGDLASDSLAIGTKVYRTHQLKGVITRLPAVNPAELEHIHSEDRAYAAREMEAFLLAWLASLRCAVLNRPQAGSLYGLPWSTEQWITLGARLDMTVQPVTRHCALGNASGFATQTTSTLRSVDVAIGRCFGAADPAQARAALALSEASKTELLRVTFADAAPGTEPVLVRADPWIDLDNPQIVDAIRERCQA
jgi:hypothetical protein